MINLKNLAGSKRFELVVGILTLSSVVLALMLYVPEIDQSPELTYAIYVFDAFVVSVLVFDFYLRTKLSGEGSRYVLRHCYEIPAMLPLVLLVVFEDPAAGIGAIVRSLRLIRFLRLMRLFRLVNLFRAAEHWRLSVFVYMCAMLQVKLSELEDRLMADSEIEQRLKAKSRSMLGYALSQSWYNFLSITKKP